MAIYKDVDKQLENDLKSYIKRGEKLKYIHISVDNNLYKEIEFRKNALGKNRYIIKGIIYVKDDNSVVKDKDMIMKLSKGAFFYKSIFNRESRFSIISIYNDKEDVKRYEYDFKRALDGLNFLKEENEENILKIKNIINQTLIFRQEKNEKLYEVIKLEEELKNKNFIFDEEIFKKSYEIYEEVLMINFRSIKSINSIKEIYEEFIKKCKKNRRSITFKFKRNAIQSLLKLEYELKYFKKLVNSYESVLSYDKGKYMKLVRDNNLKIIKENLKGIRA